MAALHTSDLSTLRRNTRELINQSRVFNVLKKLNKTAFDQLYSGRYYMTCSDEDSIKMALICAYLRSRGIMSAADMIEVEMNEKLPSSPDLFDYLLDFHENSLYEFLSDVKLKPGKEWKRNYMDKPRGMKPFTDSISKVYTPNYKKDEPSMMEERLKMSEDIDDMLEKMKESSRKLRQEYIKTKKLEASTESEPSGENSSRSGEAEESNKSSVKQVEPKHEMKEETEESSESSESTSVSEKDSTSQRWTPTAARLKTDAVKSDINSKFEAKWGPTPKKLATGKILTATPHTSGPSTMSRVNLPTPNILPMTLPPLNTRPVSIQAFGYPKLSSSENSTSGTSTERSIPSLPDDDETDEEKTKEKSDEDTTEEEEEIEKDKGKEEKKVDNKEEKKEVRTATASAFAAAAAKSDTESELEEIDELGELEAPPDSDNDSISF